MYRCNWTFRVAKLAVLSSLLLNGSLFAQQADDSFDTFITDQFPEPVPAENPAPAVEPTTPEQALPGSQQSPDNPFRAAPLETNPAPNPALSAPLSTPSRVAATPTSNISSNQQAPQSFNIRLARAPKMLGDFFGRGGATSKVPIHFGRAVHHLAGVTAAGSDDLHIIDESGSQVIYGSVGFSPTISPPLSDTVTGLQYDHHEFYAEETSDTVDVYESLTDMIPDLSDAEVYNVYKIAEIALPNPSAGDIVGRVRLQDNNSPIPQDRFFFDYNYFHNVPLNAAGVGVNRFAYGYERTCLDGMASMEVRVPMAVTLDSHITLDGSTDDSKYEYGNMAFSTKVLLSSGRDYALAAGCGVGIPTADDLDIGLSDGTDLISLENESVHLLPYLALLYSPVGYNCFFQSWLTMDYDLNGTPVYANTTGTGLQHVGRWNDQHLITLSVAAGSWLYENRSRSALLRRLAWSAEFHYTETLNDADSVVTDNITIGDPNSSLSLVNGTIGAHATIDTCTFTLGYTVPFTSDNRVFDGEFRAMMNRPF